MKLKCLVNNLTSEKCKGSVLSCISAYWTGVAGRLNTNTEQIRIGVVKYFFFMRLVYRHQQKLQREVKYRTFLQNYAGLEHTLVKHGYHLHYSLSIQILML